MIKKEPTSTTTSSPRDEADALAIAHAEYVKAFTKQKLGVHRAAVDLLFRDHIDWVRGGRQGFPRTYSFVKLLKELRSFVAERSIEDPTYRFCTHPDVNNLKEAWKVMRRSFALFSTGGQALVITTSRTVRELRLSGPVVSPRAKEGHSFPCPHEAMEATRNRLYGLCDHQTVLAAIDARSSAVDLLAAVQRGTPLLHVWAKHFLSDPDPTALVLGLLGEATMDALVRIEAEWRRDQSVDDLISDELSQIDSNLLAARETMYVLRELFRIYQHMWTWSWAAERPKPHMGIGWATLRFQDHVTQISSSYFSEPDKLRWRKAFLEHRRRVYLRLADHWQQAAVEFRVEWRKHE